jgi:hypothetical protein
MLIGRTLITRAAPETTDDEPGLAGRTPRSTGHRAPFLARFGSHVEGDVVGRTILTEAKGETTDDDGVTVTVLTEVEDTPEASSLRRIVGRTLATKAVETTDDEPSWRRA